MKAIQNKCSYYRLLSSKGLHLCIILFILLSQEKKKKVSFSPRLKLKYSGGKLSDVQWVNIKHFYHLLNAYYLPGPMP